MTQRDLLLTVIAVVAGAAIWALVAKVSGRIEAWDSSLYLSVAMPAVCALSLGLGYLSPSRPWRWGVAPVAGQLLWLLFSSSSWGLLPLGVIAFGIISVPSVLTAMLGARLAHRLGRR